MARKIKAKLIMELREQGPSRKKIDAAHVHGQRLRNLKPILDARMDKERRAGTRRQKADRPRAHVRGADYCKD